MKIYSINLNRGEEKIIYTGMIYDFIDNLEKILEPGKLDQLTEMQKLYANLFLSGLHTITYSNESYISKFESGDADFKIPVQSRVEQCMCKSYKKVINIFVDNDVVIVNNRFIKNEKCKEYIINRDSQIYRGIKLITDPRELSKYDSLLKRKVKMQDRLTKEGLDEVYDIDIINYIRGVIHNQEVTFNTGGLRICRNMLVLLKRQIKKLPKGSKERKSLAAKYNGANAAITTIMNSSSRISFDKQQARFFNVFTTLKNIYFKYLLFEGKLWLAVDIPNSQPQFLNLLLQEKYPQSYKNSVQLQKMSNLIKTGEMYTHIGKAIGMIVEGLSVDELAKIRKKIKGAIFHFFYSETNANYLLAELIEGKQTKTELTKKIIKYLRESFPDFYNLINTYKKSLGSDKEAGKLLARKLQRKESNIIKKILREVIFSNSNKIVCLTKHDSFIMPEDTDPAIIDQIINMLRLEGVNINSNDVEYQRDMLTERELQIMGIDGLPPVEGYVDPLMIKALSKLTEDIFFLDISIESCDLLLGIKRVLRRVNESKLVGRELEKKLKEISKEVKKEIDVYIILKTSKCYYRPLEPPLPHLKLEKIKFDDFLELQD